MNEKKNADSKAKKPRKTIQRKFNELPPTKLRWQCPESCFKFKTTEELEPLDSIVGQARAIEAIRLGAELNSKGYNIFVSGLSGTGRLTTVKKILEEVNTKVPDVFDYCYVNNFDNKDHPILLKLPKGQAREFAKTMEDAISFLKQRIPQLFEEDSFQAARRKIIEKYQTKEKTILDEFDQKIKPHGFVRGQLETEQGTVQPEVFPVVNEKPVQIETLEELVEKGDISQSEADIFHKKYKKFHNEIFDLARQGMKLMQEFRQALYENDTSAGSIIIDSVCNEIIEKFPDDKVKLYIEGVRKFIEENINMFVNTSISQDAQNLEDKKEEDKFYLFGVNIILDNSRTDAAPVVIETTPSYTNLFGTVERSFDSSGYWRTDFTKIKAGSILKADQGFLIVNALDLFTEPGVWQTLKRLLLYGKLEIQPYEAVFQLSQLHLKPESIDVNVKVIIIGGQTLYRLLYLQEKGFKKMFKVNAQFDYEAKKTTEMINHVAGFVAKVCREDGLPHFKPDGVAAIVEWAVEHANSQKRITLKFSDIADIIRESVFYDTGKRSKFIRRVDVQKAISWRRHRNDLMDEKLRNLILDGSILIDCEGERVGQINGLTVLDDGILSFGKPARITASVSAGSKGIINIEREVDMSGSIHNKGVMILSAILRERFARERPLAFDASIAFEQNYSGIDGDSATAAEIYVILSAITNITIKQSIAITGSVNQKGDIQPIGGVNEKIRGFYEICKARGFNGEHGVIIPIQNVDDLMMCKEVVDSVKTGNFHIYPISTIEEGVEILMDAPAGLPMEDGHYPAETIFGKVEARLEKLRKLARDDDEVKKKKKKKKTNV